MTMPVAGGGGGGGSSHYTTPIGLDRLVRKEVSLGVIREKPLPEEHIGLRLIAPWLNVESDDVIFDYIKNDSQEGMAPARAEDAEAELAQSDMLSYGQGRAAIIDWSLAHRTSASDVTRYHDNLLIQQATQGLGTNLNLNDPGRMVEQFQRKVAREEAQRMRRLQNRIEWMIVTQALDTGSIAYNDGRIKFSVNFGRPNDQQNVSVKDDTRFVSNHYYDEDVDFDPIGDFMALNDWMFDTHGVRLHRALTSPKVLNSFWMSNRFIAMAGIVVGGTPSTPIDLNYVTSGWNQEAALRKVKEVTGIEFIPYESVYRTRPIGSQTITNTRFFPEGKILFMPSPGDLGEIDDTEIGFAKTLTAPHPEGNWTPGFYEWEQQEVNPWMHVRGTGVKAFPIFPYMKYTFSLQVLTP